MPQILENASGDSNAGRGERGAEEGVDVNTVLRHQQCPDPPAECPRRDYTKRCYYQRAKANSHHVAHGGFESDFEKENHRAQLCQHPNRRVGSNELEPANSEQRKVADDYSDDELTQHRRLADALGDVTAQLCCREDDGQRQHDRRQRVAVGCSGLDKR